MPTTVTLCACHGYGRHSELKKPVQLLTEWTSREPLDKALAVNVPVEKETCPAVASCDGHSDKKDPVVQPRTVDVTGQYPHSDVLTL